MTLLFIYLAAVVLSLVLDVKDHIENTKKLTQFIDEPNDYYMMWISETVYWVIYASCLLVVAVYVAKFWNWVLDKLEGK